MVDVPVLDLRHLAPSERESEAERIIAERCQHVFDTTQLPLVRWVLLEDWVMRNTVPGRAPLRA